MNKYVTTSSHSSASPHKQLPVNPSISTLFPYNRFSIDTDLHIFPEQRILIMNIPPFYQIINQFVAISRLKYFDSFPLIVYICVTRFRKYAQRIEISGYKKSTWYILLVTTSCFCHICIRNKSLVCLAEYIIHNFERVKPQGMIFYHYLAAFLYSCVGRTIYHQYHRTISFSVFSKYFLRPLLPWTAGIRTWQENQLHTDNETDQSEECFSKLKWSFH